MQNAVLVATNADAPPLAPDGARAEVLRILHFTPGIEGARPTIQSSQSGLTSRPVAFEGNDRSWIGVGEDREVWLRCADAPHVQVHLAWRPEEGDLPSRGRPEWLQCMRELPDTIWIACVVDGWKPLDDFLCLWRLAPDSLQAREVPVHAFLALPESPGFTLYGLLRDPQGGLRAVLGTFLPDEPGQLFLRVTEPLQGAREIRLATAGESTLPIRHSIDADQISGTPINWDSGVPDCVSIPGGFVLAWSTGAEKTGPAKLVAQIYRWESLEAPRTIVLDADDAGGIWGHHAFREPDDTVSVVWRRIAGEGIVEARLAHLDRATLDGGEWTSSGVPLSTRWAWPDTSGRVVGDASSGWLVTWNHEARTVRFERVSAVLRSK